MSGYGQRLASVIASLSECVCETLTTSGGGPLCWCGLYPGAQVSWDYCGNCSGATCGMGYVRLDAVYPSSSLPQPDITPTCAAPLAARIAVGALRCVPVADDSGNLPEPMDLWESGLQIIADMGALHEAIVCCKPGYYVLGEYTPLGPRGGCAGGEWMVTVALDG